MQVSGLSAPSSRRVGLVFGALLVPQFVALGAPSVALPTAGRALGVPFGAMSWVLVAWALMSAVGMPLSGRLASRWGVRRVLVGNVVLIAVGSALAALAPSLPVLIVGRLIGGFGAGGAVIASYAVVDERLGIEGRARALGIMAAFAGTASGCGTLLGGALTEWVGWRWVIAVPVVGLLVLLPAARLAPSSGNEEERIDLLGAALLALVGGAVIVLLQAHSTGLPTPLVLALGVAAVVGALGLVRHVRHEPDGFVPRRVVGAPGFVAAGVTGLTIFAGYYGALFAAPALLERGADWSTLLVGAALLPAGLCSVVAGRVVGTLSTRITAWWITASLGALTAAGLLIGFLFFAHPVGVVVAVALATAGFAGAQAMLVGLVPKLVAKKDGDAAQGLFNFLIYGGSSIGPAAVGSLSSAIPLPVALAIVAAVPVGGMVVSLVLRPGEPGKSDRCGEGG